MAAIMPSQVEMYAAVIKVKQIEALVRTEDGNYVSKEMLKVILMMNEEESKK